MQPWFTSSKCLAKCLFHSPVDPSVCPLLPLLPSSAGVRSLLPSQTGQCSLICPISVQVQKRLLQTLSGHGTSGAVAFIPGRLSTSAPLFQHWGVISVGFFSSPGCHALFLSKLFLLYRNSRYWLRVNCLDRNMPAIMFLFDNTLFLAVYLLFLIIVIKVWP